MTDGENTQGRDNAEASAAAAEAKVPVSTIAFGTANGSIVHQGRRISVPVNAAALKLIAAQTGGTAFEAGSGEELRQVYADVGSSIGYVVEQREISVWFVGLALLCLFGSAAASLVWFSRLP
jgi:Ca-activated chloride channel family protein